ncbi:MAG: dihydroorotate dehydrogenase electron transfer subunit [Syntrophales bacterium]|jgi:dihydroorotate dehydrogenase electron transfer subunit|nr:dihydroorotate dehydrogenase electron transfer subunit [Syntrophales bacterium]MDY0044321.1 dihydroorotate dehydrogenase electron transfer subunit [Syntrophales bacterium]
MEIFRKYEKGFITENRTAAPGHYVMEIDLPASFGKALPGQFVMVQPQCKDTLFLARPFSIHGLRFSETEAKLKILYRIAGKGTQLMSRLAAGNEIKVLGPLGRGFTITPGVSKAILVAGGAGIAPLVYLAEFLKERMKDACEITGYLGAREKSCLLGMEEMGELCTNLRIATEDGSRGFHGMITDLFRDDALSFAGEDAPVYACGPYPMLSVMAGILRNGLRQCQVSMEERMACGLGACLGCAVKGRSKDDSPRYLRACTEGPVFDIREIDWNG